MSSDLNGQRIAIVVTDGFEEVEMTEPKKALESAGAKTVIISPKPGQVKGWNHVEWGHSFSVDQTIGDANVDDYDALLLPGGAMNPDKLRLEQKVVSFVRDFFEKGKPVAAICHGPWLLIDAGAAAGRTVTSWPSIRIDLRNAGARVVDEAVVVDRCLVTSRKPDDIPQFNAKMIEVFAGARTEAARRQNQTAFEARQ